MNTDTAIISTKVNFDKFGLFFFGLIPLVLLGFWKSYFSRFFGDAHSLTGYMHFHASLMTVWVGLLIVQPTLIKRKKFKIHRLIGKMSYLLMPLIVASMVFLIHKSGNLKPIEGQTFVNALLGLLGLFVFSVCYMVAVLNRNNSAIHARAMVGTGLSLLDPTLMRIMWPLFSVAGFLMVAAIVLSVFIVLIVWERKQKSGRWIFPSLLAIYFIVYFLMIFGNSINLSPLDSLMKWFYTLPLT
jgi:hypothetical protein